MASETRTEAELTHAEVFPGVEHDYGRHQPAAERRVLTRDEAERYRVRRRMMVLNSHDVEIMAKPRGWVEGQHYILDESAPDCGPPPDATGPMDVAYMSARHKRDD